MGRCILAGYDASAPAERALEFAAGLARSNDKPLLIVAVVGFQPIGVEGAPDLERLREQLDAEVARVNDEVLAPVVTRLRASGIPTDTRVVAGSSAAAALAELAREVDAEMLVVGRRGQSRLKALLWGSVASSIVQLSPVPVVVVP